MTGLALRNVTLALGRRVLIDDLSLDVACGQAATIMGPSGCGKSSLLAWICGALDPAFSVRGAVHVNDVDLTHLPPERRAVGILFQDDLLFPHLSVGGNLAFGLTQRVRDRAERARRIAAALEEIELPGYADRDPATLSGGQRARVALARVLLAEPKALLLDEPFGKLDHELRERFQRFVFAHAAARGLPVLLVTHEPADAEAAGGPIVRIDATAPD
jgi:putative thiamine transport system ATP-binding protein